MRPRAPSAARGSGWSIGPAALAIVAVSLATGCPDAPIAADDDAGPPPVLTARIDVVATSQLGAAVELRGERSSDPSGRALSFAWSVASPGDCGGALTDARAAIATFAPACIGAHTVTLIVNDAASAEATFEVTLPAPPAVSLALPAQAWRAFAAPLAGTVDSLEDGLVHAWSVTPPAGCAAPAVISDPTAVTTTVVPGCAGVHQVTLRVDTPSGRPGEASAALIVVEPLIAEAAVVDAPVGQDARVTVVLDEADAPAGAVLDVELAIASITPPDVTVAGYPKTTQVVHGARDEVVFDVPMAAPHATYEATITVRAGDVVAAPLVRALATANTPPAMALQLVAPFDVGAPFSIAAAVEDADDDVLTCAAAVVAGPEPRPAIAPSTVPIGGTCTWQGVAPADALARWTIELTASDGAVSTTATVDVAPNEAAPVILGVDVDPDAVAYACDDAGCAATARVTITALDDVDPADALAYAVEVVRDDPLAPVPAAVSVTVAPVPAAVGIFDVVVARADRGPLAGTIPIRAVATEATSLSTPLSATQPSAIVVENAPPTIDVTPSVAPDAFHTFGTGRYRASVELDVAAIDPEGNALLTTLAIVSCPGGALGEDGCGGDAGRAAWTIDEDGLVAIDAGALVDLVGAWTLRGTTVDAEGASASDDYVLSVGNRAPAQALFTSETVQQARGSDNVHRATFAFGPDFVDADGDPISYTIVQVVCPAGVTVTGPCPGGPALQIGPDNVVLSASGAQRAGFIGNYAIAVDVSDGVAVVENTSLRGYTVANTAPVLTRTSSSTYTRNHTTSGGNVTTESGSSFPFNANTADANGDLVRLELASIDSGYDFSATFPGETVPGPVAATFTVGATWAEYNADDATEVALRLVDEFGAQSNSQTVLAFLANRTPTGLNPLWGPIDAEMAGGGIVTPVTQVSGSVVGWFFTPFTVALSLSLGSISDPDGDPLVVDATDVVCDTNVVAATGSATFARLHTLSSGQTSIAAAFNADRSVTCQTTPFITRRYEIDVVTAGIGDQLRKERDLGCSGTIRLTDGRATTSQTMANGHLVAEPTGNPLACSN